MVGGFYTGEGTAIPREPSLGRAGRYASATEEAAAVDALGRFGEARLGYRRLLSLRPGRYRAVASVPGGGGARVSGPDDEAGGQRQY